MDRYLLITGTDKGIDPITRYSEHNTYDGALWCMCAQMHDVLDHHAQVPYNEHLTDTIEQAIRTGANTLNFDASRTTCKLSSHAASITHDNNNDEMFPGLPRLHWYWRVAKI